jgi:hypothetical protein
MSRIVTKVNLYKNTVGMKVLQLETGEDGFAQHVVIYSPKNARKIAERLTRLADEMEKYNDKHFPTVTISKPKEKRRNKSGQVRTYLVCKKCKHVLTYDYTPFSLSTALRIAKCKCGSFCLNDEHDRKGFKEVTYKEAMEQKRVNKAKALPKA